MKQKHRPAMAVGLITFALALLSLEGRSETYNTLSPNWGDSGVPGGIPYRTNIFTNIPAGSSLSYIQKAINTCPSNQVVQLASGGYNIGGLLIMQNGVTLRGAGPAATFLTNCDVTFNNTNYSFPYKSPTTVSWTGGYDQGTTQITLSSTNGLQAGNILGLYQTNRGITASSNICTTCDPVRDGRHSLQQYVLVTAVSNNTVTISPGLYAPLWAATNSPAAYFWPLSNTLMCAGVEDLRIHGSYDTQCVNMVCCYACWLRNVYCYHGQFHGVTVWGTKNVEIRHCTIDTATNSSDSGNDFGFVLRWSSDLRVEDNIITRVPNNKWEAISGSVFAYNFGTNFVYNPSSWLGTTEEADGGFPNYNLYEGNYIPNWVGLNLDGAAGFLTLLRNRFTGYEPGKTGGTYPIAIYPDIWYVNILGNVLGTPGVHTVYQDGLKGGEILAITAPPQAVGTFVIDGNYDTVHNGVVWATNSHSLPDSYLWISKPTNFGFLSWPPYDPVTTTSVSGAMATNIPAGYRYWLGHDPPAPPSPFSLGSIAIVSNSIQLSCPTTTNWNYQLQYRARLDPTDPWTDLGPAVPGTGGTIVLNSALNSSNTAGFYRVQVR
jgi:hypothetical protein